MYCAWCKKVKYTYNEASRTACTVSALSACTSLTLLRSVYFLTHFNMEKCVKFIVALNRWS